MITILAACAGLLIAEPQQPEINRASNEFHLDFRAGAWIPRLDGFSSLGDSGTRFDLGDDLDLDQSETVPNFELIGRWHNWSGLLSGFVFDGDGTALLLSPAEIGAFSAPAGTSVASRVDIASAAFELKYALFRPLSDQTTPWADTDVRTNNVNAAGDYVADLRFGPTLAVRYLDVEQDFDISGIGSVSGDGSWLALMGGIDMTLELRPEGGVPLIQCFELQAGISIGPAFGGDGGFLWQVRAGLTARVTDHFGVTFGYRLLESDVEDDGFDFEGSLQGLFAGVTLGF
jgi:hypothetical protein